MSHPFPSCSSLLVCYAFCCCALPARGKPPTTRTELGELEVRVGTMYVVQQLRLSPEQQRTLLAIRKRIAPAAAKYLGRRQAWRKDTADAVKGYVEFSTRTGEFPPKEVQNALHAYDAEWLDMPRTFCREVDPAAAPFDESLTDQQRAILKTLQRQRQRNVGGVYIFSVYCRDSETDPDLSPQQREAAAIQRVKVGTMSRAAHVCVAPYLEEALGVRGADFPHWWSMEEDTVQAKRIVLTGNLTFMTGISLERDQLLAITKCLRRNLPLVGSVPPYGEDVGNREAKAYAKGLQRAARTLGMGRSFSREDMDDLIALREAWRANQGKASMGGTGNAKREKARERILETVRGTLKESQLARMVAMTDCPVPTQAVVGIARAGQVAGDLVAGVGRILDIARKRGDWGTPACTAWWRREVVFLSGGPNVFQRMSDAERKANYERATAAVEKVRGMGTAEYLETRLQICEGLLSLNPLVLGALETEKASESEEGREKLVRQKLDQFFIRRGVIFLSLAEERLKHMPGGQRRH